MLNRCKKGCLHAQSGLHHLRSSPLQRPFYCDRRIIPRLEIPSNNRQVCSRPCPKQACARSNAKMGLGSCTKWGGSRDVKANKGPEGHRDGLNRQAFPKYIGLHLLVHTSLIFLIRARGCMNSAQLARITQPYIVLHYKFKSKTEFFPLRPWHSRD